jgi:hypothetical protein
MPTLRPLHNAPRVDISSILLGLRRIAANNNRAWNAIVRAAALAGGTTETI